MSCEGHRRTAIGRIVAAYAQAHPNASALTGDEAERIYQAHKRAPGADLDGVYRKYRSRNVYLKVGDADPQLVKLLKAHGLRYFPAGRDKWGERFEGLRRNDVVALMRRVQEAQTAFENGDGGGMAELVSLLEKNPAASGLAQEKGTRRKPAVAAKPGPMDRLQAATGDAALLSSEHLADLYSRIASGLVGKPRRVVLKDQRHPNGMPVFFTDLNGVIQAHPCPLGPTAPARANMIVTRASIEHELGHDQYTDPAVWKTVIEIARGERPAPGGLDAQGAAMLKHLFNVVEDGRMERRLIDASPGVAPGLAASCQLVPRWPGPSGQPEHLLVDLIGALLCDGLPYGDPDGSKRAALTGRARDLHDRLAPIVERGALGPSSEAAFFAAVDLAKALRAEGFEDFSALGLHGATPPPPPKPDVKPWTPPERKPRKPAEPHSENRPGQRKCPHCGGFLDEQGRCHNPTCPGPQPHAPDEQKPSKPQPQAQPEADADARAELERRYRQLKRENARLKRELNQQLDAQGAPA